MNWDCFAVWPNYRHNCIAVGQDNALIGRPNVDNLVRVKTAEWTSKRVYIRRYGAVHANSPVTAGDEDRVFLHVKADAAQLSFSFLRDLLWRTGLDNSDRIPYQAELSIRESVRLTTICPNTPDIGFGCSSVAAVASPVVSSEVNPRETSVSTFSSSSPLPAVTVSSTALVCGG
mmetsp:Transcript_41951/g.57223  ORF Transcript_41951/g.57223 Transcript_41951/m.57223 type:complete len:174 (-) Transcript_41951:452-973(-)